MADYATRIQALRTTVTEIADALNAFPRKADEKADLLRRAGLGQRLIASIRAGKMIRYTAEQDFAVLVQKVAGLQAELNLLEAEVDEEVQDLTDEQEFYPPEV
jgi:hypothetical protein